MPSDNSLDSVDTILLFLGFSNFKGSVKNLKDLASTNPHFSQPVDRGKIEDTLHHELARDDGLVQMVSENVLSKCFFNHLG